jgi:hypothetical protein
MRRFARTRSRGLAIALAIVAVFALASVAVGYWSGAGAGSTSTRLADPLPLTLSPGTPSDPFAPGDVAGISVVISNPNKFEAYTSRLTLDNDVAEPFSVDSAHSGCIVSVASGVLSLDPARTTNGGRGWTVPPRIGANDGTLVVHLTDALIMSNAAANACQGATFTIALDVAS